ncbi:MAG: 23S rRNA (pseudouridine(1915)-N(3))-methyltransferase RlmH [Deltaproteobacteria bacterium]
MKLVVVIVGKDRGDPIVGASDDYLQRLQHYFPAEVVEVKEEPAKKGRSVEVVKRAEAERIRRVIPDGAITIALDERGKAYRSEQLAEKLERWQVEGTRNVALVIGGPNGLDAELLKKARERWSLSSLTLPHRIARLVLLEQLYRAGTILRREPYHRGD